ncbi:MAG: ASCH domain-containing protein [Cyanobacteria bacterium P01_H01_bin.152]
MLIRKPILERIKVGDVTLAFRRWQRPTVKEGSTLKTAVGVLIIQSIEKVALESITDRDARSAGYSDLESLLKELRAREGQAYRIRLAYLGDDPRIALREDVNLSADDLDNIVSRLKRLDSRSQTGHWTQTVLSAIDAYPMTVAAELAAHTGFEKDWLKTNIRKLKNLGLTISHQSGYELSPRGAIVLNHLQEHP